MTVVSPKMKCPKCSAEMNFHAEKIVYGVDAGEGGVLHGRLLEFHACPQCGAAASRGSDSLSEPLPS